MSHEWSPAQIFVGSYLAVLIAVVYRIIISVVTNSLRLVEPFRQLSEPNEALADQALFSSCHDQLAIVGILRAISGRRWVLISTSVASLAACLLPALASEAVIADTDWGCAYSLLANPNPCPARVAISPVVIRATQAILLINAAIMIAMLATLSSTTTDLPGDPSSIAAVAQLIGPDVSDLMSDAAVDSKSQLRHRLEGRLYKLGRFGSKNGASRYCIHVHATKSGMVDSVTTTTPMASTYTAIKNRYWTVAIITIMTLLAELLSILIGSIPFAPGQTYYQYRLASYLCMSILGIMVLGVVVLMIGRWHEPKIPFLPDVLGTKMY
ncbi:hypothetical protein CLAFUW4_08202 [Fulvia fulva]|uniref:Uncharacterized protein n=1 Tax=Passalora fulva TaxID=5499 RepID=A0A9Q8LCG9_PASFU|nr:uncharacterized protein CLAFUR5_08314 [Fulvia fulva]KAK4628843.1 hypothetical protein CLAFUR4_08207 [Fulvia fulva]KAK4630548.1 hypothetical protein CLAFUR0_08202 [Fulvia fulva]UJO14883.1 hypothetical protein CLAFUR5_08314 [Fulvia fulva]WPV12306.1 hypothetical protein CLAFUW4_08202 [Fulvia fulva]WPV27129.1 hypothetical protein CLAFUW7_08202 [Fulvia fulva]